MQYRMLGSTGVQVSAIGLGGFHIAKDTTPDESTRIVRAAIDGGITFMDNSWDYHKGESEVRMGNALRDGYRQKVFLMTKLDGHTKAAAAAQLEQSLRRLQTETIDLVQMHEVIRMDDPEQILAPGGAIEALLEARQAGKLRFIGFTGHKSPEIHRKMATRDFPWDTVQMPLNCFDHHFQSFEATVLPLLVERGIGVLGMKPMAAGELLKSGTVSAPECLRYALHLQTSVVITGCENVAQVEQAIQAGSAYTPMSEAELQNLLERTKPAAATGTFEQYKTTDRHDGTTKNPQWLTGAAA